MRYFLATAIVLALFATSASAQLVPPPEYDRAYKGHLIISRINSTTEVGLLCGQPVRWSAVHNAEIMSATSSWQPMMSFEFGATPSI